MTYERACMTTQEEEYYMDMLETMIEHNDRTKKPLSKDKLRRANNMVVAETEEEESNANNVTTDTLIQTPVTANASK